MKKCYISNCTTHILFSQAEWAEWMETSSKGWSSNAREIAKSWLKTRLQPRLV